MATQQIAFINGPNNITKIIRIGDIPTWSLFKIAVVELFPAVADQHISFSYKLDSQTITMDCNKDFDNALPILADSRCSIKIELKKETVPISPSPKRGYDTQTTLTGSLKRQLSSPTRESDDEIQEKKSKIETKSPVQYKWKKKINTKGVNDAKEIQMIKDKVENAPDYKTALSVYKAAIKPHSQQLNVFINARKVIAKAFGHSKDYTGPSYIRSFWKAICPFCGENVVLEMNSLKRLAEHCQNMHKLSGGASIYQHLGEFGGSGNNTPAWPELLRYRSKVKPPPLPGDKEYAYINIAALHSIHPRSLLECDSVVALLSLVELISQGVVPFDHVILQAIQCFTGTINGTWNHRSIPWSRFPAWNSLCNAISLHGSPAAVQLLRGKPKSAKTSINPSEINFICPSSTKMERDAPFISLEEGPQQHLLDAFQQVLHSSPSGLISETAHVMITPIIISADSQPLAQGCWIRGNEICGVHPPISAEKAVEIYSQPILQRHQTLRDLVETQVNGVTEYYVVAGGCDWAIDVGRCWSVRSSKNLAISKHMQNMVEAAERCTNCVKNDQDVCSFSAWCELCQRKMQVCTICSAAGQQEWHFLRRPCEYCILTKKKCCRNWVMTVITDGEAINVKAGKELNTLMGNGTIVPTTSVMYDPYHQARGQRNAIANYILYRNRSRFCIGLLSSIRVSNHRVLANKLMQSCTEQALHGRDKHSMDLVRILFRSEVEEVVRESKAVLMTLYPEQYRPWKQKKVDEFVPSVVCQVKRGDLIVGSTTNIFQVRLKYPVHVSLLTTTPEKLLHVEGVPLHKLQLRNTQCLAVWYEARNYAWILFIDNGQLGWIRLKYNGNASSATLVPGHCCGGLINCYGLKRLTLRCLAPLRDNEVAVGDNDSIHFLKMGSEENGKWDAEYLITIKLDGSPLSICRSIHDKIIYVLVNTDNQSVIKEISWKSHKKKKQNEVKDLGCMFTNASFMIRYNNGLLVAEINQIHYVTCDQKWTSKVLIGNIHISNLFDGPVSETAIYKPVYMCCEGDTIFIVCNDSSSALRMYTPTKELADFILLNREFMDLWDILDPSHKGPRKLPSWSDSISKLEKIVQNNDAWYKDTIEGLALPADYKSLRGAEGVPAFSTHKLWKTNLESLQRISNFAYGVLDYDYLQIHRFNTMDVEHGFGNAASHSWDNIQTQLTYASLCDRKRTEIIKARCMNGYSYVTHPKGKRYSPAATSFPIEASIPLSFIQSRSSMRQKKGSMRTKSRELRADKEATLAMNQIQQILAKQPQQRLRDTYRRHWSHRPHLTTPLSFNVLPVVTQDEVKRHTRVTRLNERSETKTSMIDPSQITGYDSPESENEFDNVSSESDEEPWELEVGLLVFVKAPATNKLPFYLGEIMEIKGDQVKMWWYGGNNRPSGQWRPLYVDPKDDMLTPQKVRNARYHTDWVASTTILRGDSLRNFKLNNNNHIPARILGILQKWPGLCSWKE